MTCLRRWNLIWTLACAVFFLLTEIAAALMTKDEKDCIARAAQEAMQNSKEFMKTFNETLVKAKEKYC